MAVTMGSLFDGSGGFPLAGAMCGMKPLWASEIEPYPIAVSHARFPEMEHLGSVTEIDGGKISPVDVITFGSPCQDLSVAGKRVGIHEGQRSNLFFEAIRIIKEMREATNGEYPKFAVWENVPGAFSSNKGEDFRCVLESFAQIGGEADVSIPRPEGGKWCTAGEIMGDGYTIAWRVLDAQYWGVPQRRKRIYLVADFAGRSAGEILFKSEGLSGYSAPSGAPGQDAADDAARGTGGSRGVECLNPWDSQSYRQYEADGVYPALQAHQGGRYEGVCYALDSMSSNSMKSSNPRSGFHEETIAKTLQAGGVDPTCNQGGNVIVEPVYALQGNGIDRAETAGCNGKGWREDVCYTLNTIDRPAICFKPGQGAKARSMGESETTAPTLASEAGGNAVPGVCYPINEQIATRHNALGERTGLGIGKLGDPAFTLQAAHPHIVRVMASGQGAKARSIGASETVSPTLGSEAGVNSTLTAGNGTSSVLTSGRPPRKYIIRRLTPLECCRLQGFPDGWGVLNHKDRLSDEELAFWQQVRDTCASIGGKPTKKYSAEALTKWYNGLHTDSAEYKMWGNGIALPCAAMVMAGIQWASGQR